MVGSPAQANLTAAWRTDSQWATGYCSTALIRNVGGTTATWWTLTFQVPAGVTITQSWSGSVTRNGATVTVQPYTWGSVISPGQTRSDFGFCATR